MPSPYFAAYSSASHFAAGGASVASPRVVIGRTCTIEIGMPGRHDGSITHSISTGLPNWLFDVRDRFPQRADHFRRKTLRSLKARRQRLFGDAAARRIE